MRKILKKYLQENQPVHPLADLGNSSFEEYYGANPVHLSARLLQDTQELCFSSEIPNYPPEQKTSLSALLDYALNLSMYAIPRMSVNQKSRQNKIREYPLQQQSEMNIHSKFGIPEDHRIPEKQMEASLEQHDKLDFAAWLVSLKSPRNEKLSENKHNQRKTLRGLTEEKIVHHTSQVENIPASEALAELLLSQGYKLEAIKMFEHLITRIPEKSAIFADRILKIKQKKI